MRSFQSRVERIETAIRDKTSGCTMTFLDGRGEVLAWVRIPGNENIVFVDDIDDDEDSPVPATI